MKISYFFLFAVCTSSVYAAPPSLDSSSYDSYPATSNQIVDSLVKLQSDVSQLKTKVADLQVRQKRLENLRASAISPLQSTSLPSTLAPHNPANELLGEKSRYEYAYSAFRAGSYDQAIAEFQAIVSTYPNGEYADNSLYWTGEALLKKGDKQKAMKAFDRVVYAYPRSAKVPDALLKLGITQTSLGNKTKAKEYYDYLIATYPGTTSANVAYTKRAGLY